MIWKNNFTWSESYIQSIKKLVGQHLLDTASADVDQHEAADLVGVAVEVREKLGPPAALVFGLQAGQGAGRPSLAKALREMGLARSAVQAYSPPTGTPPEEGPR